MLDAQPEYAAPAELRATFGLSRAEVYRRLTTGDFVARKVGSRTYVELASVRAFFDAAPRANFRAPVKGVGRGRRGARPVERKAA